MTNVLEKVPLHDLHVAMGARMVGFAGYEMPLQYKLGVLGEHLHTRAAAGLFDVSHMGQIVVRPKFGNTADAALALESLIPVDILSLEDGRQRYALLTNDSGGILDDLMVANLDGMFLIVANAARKAHDFAHLLDWLSGTCDVSLLQDRALLALQGPKAEDALATLAPEVRAMRFMDVRRLLLGGNECIVSRSGYSGEDGYEISVAAHGAEPLARSLLSHPDVLAVGLGARDSLRLEAGLCLYGHDITEATTPVEGALTWSIQKARRPGGVRAGGYPGAATIGRELADGALRKRVGLRPVGRAPLREGVKLFASVEATETIGEITSGGFGPSIDGPIAMGLVASQFTQVGSIVFGEQRGARHELTVVAMPFLPHTYKR